MFYYCQYLGLYNNLQLYFIIYNIYFIFIKKTRHHYKLINIIKKLYVY